MYGFGSSEIDLSTCYKGRPEKVLIEDPFSSIIKTNPQELLRPSSVLIEDQKKDKTGLIFTAPIFCCLTRVQVSAGVVLLLDFIYKNIIKVIAYLKYFSLFEFV